MISRRSVLRGGGARIGARIGAQGILQSRVDAHPEVRTYPMERNEIPIG